MPKRQSLDYDIGRLTENIKASTGKGVDALFSPQSPTPNEDMKLQTDTLQSKEKKDSDPEIKAVGQANQKVQKEQFDSNLDSPLSSYLASYLASSMSKAKKAIRQSGREVLFIRATLEEKDDLDDAVYQLKKEMRVDTTRTDLTRIAIIYLLEDYRNNKDSSFLTQLFQSINE